MGNAMGRSLWLLTLLALCVVSLPQRVRATSVSWANSSKIVRWPTRTVKFAIDKNGFSGITDGSDVQAVLQAFQMWQSVSCSDLKFEYLANQAVDPNKMMPAVYQQNGGYYYQEANGVNELGWVTNWPYGPFVLGVTVPTFLLSGEITEADIAFNAGTTWITNPQGNNNQKNDVLSIALHEIGHLFGAQHVLGGFSEDAPPVMAPSAASWRWQTTRVLKDDDKRAICFLYPTTTYTCTSDAECPYVVADQGNKEIYLARYLCKSGSCSAVSYVIPSANKGLGESCVSDQYDCKPELYCQPMQNGSVCSRDCDPNNSDCPANFYCAGFFNSSGGACLPGSAPQPDQPKKLGELCAYSSQCESGLCVGVSQTQSYCRAKCNPNTPTCAQGTYCAPLQSSGGACIPGDPPGGSGQKKPNGQACVSGSDCESGVCAGDQTSGQYYCRQQCQPATPNCGQNESCVGFADSGGGACIPSASTTQQNDKGTGAPCGGDAECTSKQCIRLAEDAPAFCTATCAQDSDCPCGMECSNTSIGKLCIPGDRVGCVELGGSCTLSSECTSGVCATGKCADACDITLSEQCDLPAKCKRNEKGSVSGSCVTPGTKKVGDVCLGDDECETLFCEDSGQGAKICLVPCRADQPNCPSGQSCTPVYNTIGGCFLPDGSPAPSGTGTTPTPGADASGTVSKKSSGCGAVSGAPTHVPYWLLLCLLALLHRRRRQRQSKAR